MAFLLFSPSAAICFQGYFHISHAPVLARGRVIFLTGSGDEAVFWRFAYVSFFCSLLFLFLFS
jgi:hypothetical protein